MLVAAAPRRRLLGLVGAVAATALALSGCSAGQDAQTVEQTSVVDGTAFEAGQVDLRDIGLVAPTGPSYAQGSNAFLEGLVVNKALDEDQLVSVSSPIATSVVLYGNQAAALLGLAPTPSETASPTDSSSPTDSASPTDSGSTATGAPSNTGSPTQGGSPSQTTPLPTDGGSTSASTPTAPAASALTEVPLPTNQAVQFGYQSDQLAIVFVGLTEQLFPSQTFPVTFTFANGGSVTAVVAVKLPVGSTLDAPTVDTEEHE